MFIYNILFKMGNHREMQQGREASTRTVLVQAESVPQAISLIAASYKNVQPRQLSHFKVLDKRDGSPQLLECPQFYQGDKDEIPDEGEIVITVRA